MKFKKIILMLIFLCLVNVTIFAAVGCFSRSKNPRLYDEVLQARQPTNIGEEQTLPMDTGGGQNQQVEAPLSPLESFIAGNEMETEDGGSVALLRSDPGAVPETMTLSDNHGGNTALDIPDDVAIETSPWIVNAEWSVEKDWGRVDFSVDVSGGGWRVDATIHRPNGTEAGTIWACSDAGADGGLDHKLQDLGAIFYLGFVAGIGEELENRGDTLALLSSPQEGD